MLMPLTEIEKTGPERCLVRVNVGSGGDGMYVLTEPMA